MPQADHSARALHHANTRQTSLKGYGQLRIAITQNTGLSNEFLRLNKSFVMSVSPLEGDLFVGEFS